MDPSWVRRCRFSTRKRRLRRHRESLPGWQSWSDQENLTFSVGDPYEPSFTTVFLGKGPTTHVKKLQLQHLDLFKLWLFKKSMDSSAKKLPLKIIKSQNVTKSKIVKLWFCQAQNVGRYIWASGGCSQLNRLFPEFEKNPSQTKLWVCRICNENLFGDYTKPKPSYTLLSPLTSRPWKEAHPFDTKIFRGWNWDYFRSHDDLHLIMKQRLGSWNLKYVFFLNLLGMLLGRWSDLTSLFCRWVHL